jgi:transposase
LSGSDAEPRIHHVWEIPPVSPHVTEYRLHALRCRGCGHVTRAALPEGVPTRWFGPRVEAITALATGVYRVSKRTTVELLRDLFGLPMSVGAVIDSQHAMSHALAGPFDEAHAYAKRQPVKHADETGWWQKNGRAWLWAVVTPLVTVFLVRAKRSADVARELLGATVGVLVADRYKGYHHWPARAYQFCWAHLVRDFVAMAERGGGSRRVGEALLDEARTMFALWHRVREGRLSRFFFRIHMGPVRGRVEALLGEGARLAHPRTAGLCGSLLERTQALWTFVETEGVEPTNNAAERAVRPAVLWRKGSFGTQSEEGSRFVERLLTTLMTCRQQGRNVLDFLVAARNAALNGTPAPSLVPRTRSP